MDKIDFDAIEVHKPKTYQVNLCISPELICENTTTGEKIKVNSHIDLNVNLGIPRDCNPDCVEDLIQQLLLVNLPLLIEKIKNEPLKNWVTEQRIPTNNTVVPSSERILH